MKPLLVYGAREFASVIVALAADVGANVVGCVDDLHSGPGVLGTYADVRQRHPPAACDMALAIGYRHLSARWAAYLRARADGYAFPALVHPRAHVHVSATLGAGVFVMAGAIVDCRARLADAVVVWPGAVVNHDSVIGANTFLSPQATVCGASTLGRDCFVGAGSVVVDHVDVSDGTFLKAGRVFTGRQDGRRTDGADSKVKETDG